MTLTIFLLINNHLFVLSYVEVSIPNTNKLYTVV